ncbi:MAG: plastocyanin/azurin family copper-binding protein [Solirubrobacterales bacterium]
MRKSLAVVSAVAVVLGIGVIVGSAGGAADMGSHRAATKVHQVTVPEADRFTPFAMTIRSGDTVRWVNNDEDDHFVVSDDAFNTAGHEGTDQELGADGGTIALRFNHPGTFVYYCKLHAQLDAFNQPVAPGPEGGIQDANGNFGTPMSGVITVVPGNPHGETDG